MSPHTDDVDYAVCTSPSSELTDRTEAEHHDAPAFGEVGKLRRMVGRVQDV